MKLRDYQEKICKETAIKLSKGIKKIVVQLPTGAGKTVTFATISKRYNEKSNKSVLILVHRKELLQQTRRTLYNAFGINCQIIIAGMKHIPQSPVYVGMVESVSRRVDRIKNIGLVIIDECHIANFNKIHQHFNDAYFIGFSATPLTASKHKPLNLYYEDIVCGIDIPELISLGSLCPNQTFAAKDSVNRSSLKIKAGDFDTNLMGIEFSKQQHVNNTVTVYKQKADNTKCIIFNSNIEHSIKVTQAFIDNGYNCRHFDGETESKERSEVLAWFESTPGAILCNVGIATTGFDEPTIETVIMNRATMSMPLWLQCTGRGSRPTDEKKHFTIIDMGSNAVTHGDWCDSRNWHDIFFNPPKKGKDGVAPVKDCPKCQAIVPISSSVCKFCGHIFPHPKPKIEQELSEFVLVTKNLDILRIIEDNKHHKEYFPLFDIIRTIAAEAKYYSKTMDDEVFNFILEKCNEKVKEWCKISSQNPSNKLKRFDDFHKKLTKDNLIDQLKKHYKKWEPIQ